jgi:uncharacterized RDD family membrane protein YckC
VSQPVPQPSWKEEVNRRLEAHKNRRGIAVVEQQPSNEEQGSVSERAAKAAARVAARYAKAPSYSEMQAAEARAALRTAEAATRVALEAQAAAQVALANLESAAEEQLRFAEEDLPTHSAAQQQVVSPVRAPESTPKQSAQTLRQNIELRWEPDMPARPVAQPEVHPRKKPDASSAATEDWLTDAHLKSEAMFEQPIEVVDAQPIHANLIHFPRELVATRRMRPRLAETSQSPASESDGQLSIFEMEPGSVSIEPTAGLNEAAAPTPSWSGPEWSKIELDAQVDSHRAGQQATPRETQAASSGLPLAPLELRLMAFAVDIALIVGMFSAAAFSIARHIEQAPAMKSAEAIAVAALVLIAVLYQVFFLLVMKSTPGMTYAGIAVCTFDDEHPTQTQLRNRLVALLISILPVGLGMAWSIFDEDHLCWHDRFSRTYLRKC